MEWSDLVAAVAPTIDDADEDLLEQICELVKQADATPLVDHVTGEPLVYEDGSPAHKGHGFATWLDGLQAGSWRLPRRMPRAVLEHYAHEHASPFRRCEDCLMILPQRVPGGWTICPICGGKRISWKCLSNGDPHHVYTPLTHGDGKMALPRGDE
jgi:hypothetical protein